MITFNDLEFKPFTDIRGGVWARVKFDNGYGASVVMHKYSYGGDQGLYELAVLNSKDELCYDTPVTNDVLGHLTPDDVTEALRKIQELHNASNNA